MVAYYMDNCGNSTGFSTMTESDDFERLLATSLDEFLITGLLVQNERKRRL
jgi:hypothetical protein